MQPATTHCRGFMAVGVAEVGLGKFWAQFSCKHRQGEVRPSPSDSQQPLQQSFAHFVPQILMRQEKIADDG